MLAGIAKNPQEVQAAARSENVSRRKKHRSGKHIHDVIRVGRGQGGRRTTEEDLVLDEIAFQTYRVWRFQGLTQAAAYFTTHPHKRGRIKQSTATRLAIREIAYVEEHHADDIKAMMQAHGLDAARLAVEMDSRLQAMTLREIVKSRLMKRKNKDGRYRNVVLITRDTEKVEDNTTRMRATELLADVLGARKLPTGGVQQNVGIIYVLGGKIMKKRQERLDV